MTVGVRDFEVKDFLSPSQFFGFDAEIFSLAVNLQDSPSILGALD